MLTHFWMGAYALGWIGHVELVGRIYMAEPVAIAGLLFLRPVSALRSSPALRAVLVSYGLLLCGFILSDFVNDTSVIESIKGWATPVFAALQLIFVYACLRLRPESLLTFLLILACHKLAFGDVAYNANIGLDNPALAFDANNPNYFKIRFIPFLSPVIALASILIFRIWRTASVVFLAACGVIFVLLDARSSGLVLILAALLTWVVMQRWRLNGIAVTFMAAFFFVFGYGAYVGYVDYVLAHNPSG